MIQFLVNQSNLITDSGGGSLAGKCGGAEVLKTIKFVFKILDYVCAIVPVALILLISIDFVRNVIAKNEDDMKKRLQIAIKRIILCVILFLVPTIVRISNTVLGNLGVDYAECVKIATTYNDFSAFEIEMPDVTISKDVKEENVNTYEPGSEDMYSDGSSGIDDSSTAGSDASGGGSSSEGGNSSSNVQNIFVGDSRTNGMQLVVGTKNGDIWYCKDGAQYDWFINSGIPSIKGEVGTHKDKQYNVFINMGVNDLDHQNLYVEQYAKIAADYENVKVIAVSVNKVVDNLSTYAKNSSIEAFNRVLSNKAKHTDRMVYCDTYSTVSFEFDSSGIHYQPSTYLKIYDAMKKCA